MVERRVPSKVRQVDGRAAVAQQPRDARRVAALGSVHEHRPLSPPTLRARDAREELLLVARRTTEAACVRDRRRPRAAVVLRYLLGGRVDGEGGGRRPLRAPGAGRRGDAR